MRIFPRSFLLTGAGFAGAAFFVVKLFVVLQRGVADFADCLFGSAVVAGHRVPRMFRRQRRAGRCGSSLRDVSGGDIRYHGASAQRPSVATRTRPDQP
jgi:hypothetical protein